MNRILTAIIAGSACMLSLLVPTHAEAALVTASGYVARVSTGWRGASKYFVVKLDRDAATGCTSKNEFAVTASDVNFDQNVSLSTTAALSGKWVTIVYDSGACDANGLAPVYAVQLFK